MRNSALLLNKGMHIDWAGRNALIRAIESDFTVLDFEGGQKQMVKTGIIAQAYSEGDLTITVPDLPVAFQPLRTQEHIDLAEEILLYLLPLDEEEKPRSRKTIKRVIETIKAGLSDKKKLEAPSDSKVYRWYDLWVENNRNVVPLVIKKPQKERAKQFAPETLDLVEKIIYAEYLRQNGSNKLQVFREFMKQFKQGGFPGKCVSQSRFYEILAGLDPIEVALAREGKDAARRLARTCKTHFIADFPLQRVEIDAVHLKVGLLDDETGTYVGSPIIYLAIDVYTRCIVGYSISYGTKGSEISAAVIDCLKDCMLPKAHLGLPLSGKPLSFVCDAGTAFRSKMIVSFLANMGCHHHTTETATPWKKPFIERFNLTLKQQLATKIPGFMGSRSEGKSYDYTMQQLATVTVSKFKEYLEEYIRDIYHHNPHKGLQGHTPFQEATESAKKFRPQIVSDMNKFNLYRGIEKEVTIQGHAGVQIAKIFYHSDELKRIYLNLKGNTDTKNPKVTVLFDENDISQITVLDDEKLEIFTVPCIDPIATPGMHKTVYQSLRASKQTEDHKTFSTKRTAATDKPKKKVRNNTVVGSTALEQAVAVAQSIEDLDKMIAEGVKRKARDHSDKPTKDVAPDRSSSESKKTRTRNEVK